MSWTVEISIKNTSSSKLPCRIKKGQVFENKKVGTGFQNVAAVKDYIFDIPPNTTHKVHIEVLCINQRLAAPQGFLNVTSFAVSKNFSSQDELWNIMNTINQ